jgi:hypothetical protein
MREIEIASAVNAAEEFADMIVENCPRRDAWIGIKR